MIKRNWAIALTGVVLLSWTALGHTEDAKPAAPAAPAAAVSDEKAKDIRRLIELTGGANIGEDMLKQMSEGFKQTNPNVPQAFWDDIKKNTDFDGLTKAVIPAYDKNLSGDEIKEMIKFYESPTGKKMIQVMPQIMQESYPIVMQWSNDLAEKVQKKLEEKGYLKPPAPPAAPATPATPAAK